MSYRLIKGFKSHCRNIVSGCIDALDDVDIMEAILHTIGERHGRRGQDRQQFIVSYVRFITAAFARSFSLIIFLIGNVN